MSHPVSEDVAFRVERLTDAITAMWIDASRMQTEPAAMLSRIVTHDDPRIPHEAEVRGFLREAVRGALVRTPPPPRTALQKVADFLFRWDRE